MKGRASQQNGGRKKIDRYPERSILTISYSELELLLRDYNIACSKRPSIGLMIIGIAGTTIPLFTSEFQSFMGVSGERFKGFVWCLVLAQFMFLVYSVLRFVYLKFRFRDRYMTDPTQLVRAIEHINRG